MTTVAMSRIANHAMAQTDGSRIVWIRKLITGMFLTLKKERKFAMKARFIVLSVACFAILLLSGMPANAQTLITFDDISIATNASLISITNGYQGLSWSNMFALNVFYQTRLYGVTSGDNYGMVSASNVAFNGGGSPAEIDSPGTDFNFLSTYLAGAWNNNLSIEVQGYRDTNLIYDETLVVTATNPTFVTFDYLDINRLYFNSFGGQDAGFGEGPGEQLVMDNFMFEFIPEPSSLLLAALGVVSLTAFLRRKRT